MEIIYKLIDEFGFKLHLNSNKKKSVLFILLILGNNVIISNYALVFERE